MADYSADIQSAYDSIKEAGGKITFTGVAPDTAPADPDAPWEGNADEPADIEHVGVLFPLAAQTRQTAEGNHQVLIPALGLPFEPTIGLQFTDGKGRKYQITALSVLAPDPEQIILFDCECAIWPAPTE